MASSMPRRFPPSFPVTPPKACAALWYKRRRGDTELCGALAGCPLRHAFGMTPPPEGEPSLASPFGGRWCPVGTVQRLVSAAASVGDGRSPLGCITRAGRRECPPREGGEGKPLARSPASGKLPSRCAAVREKRFAVSLAFSHALRAYKGKAVGLWSHLPVRSAQGVCHRQTAPYNPQLLKKLAKLLRSLRSASCAHVRYPLDEHERQRAAKGAN